MPKFKLKSLIAFVLLGALIYAFRHAHGQVSDYIIAAFVIIIFWYLLGLQLAFSNLRNIFFLTVFFGTIIFVFRVIFPISGPIGIIGAFQGFDLDPAQIGLLKGSHETALEIHFDKRPALLERYFKIGDFVYTRDGLHYSVKNQALDLSKLPKTSVWVSTHLIGNELDHDVDRVRSWFMSSMSYTLSPGSLNSSTPLDQFLFERRAGFCEHFAASLSSILRLKGYRSRVAFGYAGGSWNPFFKVLTYENTDAHAWVEAFDPQINQYKIIDPTSWVFPGVSMERSITVDLSWCLLTGIVFFFLFGLLFIRRGNGLDRFILKISQLENKHSLGSKGLTLSERISRLAALKGVSQDKMRSSLKIYFKMYDLEENASKLDRSLKKSLTDW